MLAHVLELDDRLLVVLAEDLHAEGGLTGVAIATLFSNPSMSLSR
jgi:hypothetical protein